VSEEEAMDISVVCPFYNEASILEHAVRTLLGRLSSLEGEWELIIVNDGSTDGSADIASRLAREYPWLRVLGYRCNRGRGYALRTGIAAAKGDIIVTTEIDLSWGDDIVRELVEEMREHPDCDIVVASPHLPGGGYRNVPPKRVWLSRIGNRVIRACVSNAATMNTGMTRAYRRDTIQIMPLLEDGKEFHLEVLLKATEFGMHIREIPAWLEWKEYKHEGQRVKRKSSSRVKRLIMSHSLFSLFANPVRYVWAASLLALGLGGLCVVAAAILKYMLHMVAAYTALLGISLIIVGSVLFVLGVVVRQGNMIQRELWVVQRNQIAHQKQESERQAAKEEHSRWAVG
jgi:glycosyltransferase involved in cell wall biosynthesis